MSRDHRKLWAFQESDELVLEVYRTTAMLPAEERYGLQSQIRRAAVSVPTNIVEGSARPGTTDYCRFLWIALSSARETSYLLGLSARLHYLDATTVQAMTKRYDSVCAALFNAIQTLETDEGRSAKP